LQVIDNQNSWSVHLCNKHDVVNAWRVCAYVV
jgi:hypothetical protein